jgi:hypothetical protein
MNEEARRMIERIRGVGTNLTFEGGYVADFIERLDNVLEVRGVVLEGSVLKLLVGEPRGAGQEDLLRVITKACLLNVAAAGYEDTEHGKILYFEFYIPPWNEMVL